MIMHSSGNIRRNSYLILPSGGADVKKYLHYITFTGKNIKLEWAPILSSALNNELEHQHHC